MEVGLSLGNLINAAEKGMALEGARKMDPAVHHVITIVVASCIDQNNKRKPPTVSPSLENDGLSCTSTHRSPKTATP